MNITLQRKILYAKGRIEKNCILLEALFKLCVYHRDVKVPFVILCLPMPSVCVYLGGGWTPFLTMYPLFGFIIIL